MDTVLALTIGYALRGMTHQMAQTGQVARVSDLRSLNSSGANGQNNSGPSVSVPPAAFYAGISVPPAAFYAAVASRALDWQLFIHLGQYDADLETHQALVETLMKAYSQYLDDQEAPINTTVYRAFRCDIPEAIVAASDIRNRQLDFPLTGLESVVYEQLAKFPNRVEPNREDAVGLQVEYRIAQAICASLDVCSWENLDLVEVLYEFYEESLPRSLSQAFLTDSGRVVLPSVGELTEAVVRFQKNWVNNQRFPQSRIA